MNALQIAEVHALLRRHGVHDLMKVRAGPDGMDILRHPATAEPRERKLLDYHIAPQSSGDFACWVIGGSYNVNRGDTPAQALERTMTSPRSW